MAARIIEKRPKQITLIAPLTAFLFCIGSGTGNIIYPLLPVIYDVSYKNRIRPSRPLTVTVVQSGIALAASPVSAAMAAMLTLTDVAPYNLGPRPDPRDHPPGVRHRHHRDLARGQPDVEGPRRRPRGAGEDRLRGAGPARGGRSRTASPAACEAHLHHAGPQLRPGLPRSASSRSSSSGCSPTCGPSFEVDGETVSIDMTTHHRPGHVRRRRDHPVPRPPGRADRSGPVGVQGRHDLGDRAVRDRLADGHLHRRPRGRTSSSTIGEWVTNWQFIFALAVFLVAALTTSQSTATRTIVPIGLAAGLPAGVVTGMWAGALGGVYTLPANGTQIAAANFDLDRAPPSWAPSCSTTASSSRCSCCRSPPSPSAR